ncbi:MAG TPA: hypothetical protein VJL83_03220 [Patescibacteria group bacterium]|nr:hypothetical protein [Patescibacteria group bacterium]
MSKYVELDYYQLVPEETSEEVDLERRNFLRLAGGGLLIGGGALVGAGLAKAGYEIFRFNERVSGPVQQIDDGKAQLAVASEELYKQACGEADLSQLANPCEKIDNMTANIAQAKERQGSIVRESEQEQLKALGELLGGATIAGAGELVRKLVSRVK